MCDNVRLSNMQDVLHAKAVEVHMQTHHSNEHRNSAEMRKFNFCRVRCVEYKMRQTYKSLRVTKSLGNVIKMQYAYIKYPAAMIRGLLKRHMIWEHHPGAAQAPSCSVSWTVSEWNYSYVRSGDVKISESWWETR